MCLNYNIVGKPQYKSTIIKLEFYYLTNSLYFLRARQQNHNILYYNYCYRELISPPQNTIKQGIFDIKSD